MLMGVIYSTCFFLFFHISKSCLFWSGDNQKPRFFWIFRWAWVISIGWYSRYWPWIDK
jgi:hypothetical protein